ncbi:MAG: tetratricopeptide repeat protein [Planctomycetaceae bacterium]
MRFTFTILSIGLLVILATGCSPRAGTTSEEDVSRGNEKLSEVDEMQEVEDVTKNDYGKMTQVDRSVKQQAMADLDKAIQDDPENADAWYARGFARLSHSDAILPAIGDFTRAIELKPNFARAYLMRGRAYESLGDNGKARIDREKALELDPGID